MQIKEIQFNNNMPLRISILSVKRYPIHWNGDITEIIMPLKGSIEIVTDFEKNTVQEGDFWFVNNRSIHSIESDSGSIIACFYIDLNYFQEQFEYIKYMFFRSSPYSKDLAKHPDNDIHKDYKIRFRNLLVSILSNYSQAPTISKEVIEKLLNRLVYAMVFEFNWLEFIERKESFISSVHLDRYHRILKYVDEHYSEKITLDDIISREYITKTYFSHFWKEISSFSFQERINYERVMKSTRMLLSDMTITEISDSCGFSDPKYYYKNFKRWFGCMPLEYKAKCEEYIKMGSDFQILDLDDVDTDTIVEAYLKKYFEIYFNEDVDSEAARIINHYANIRYLHMFNKSGQDKIPKYTNINILGAYCFKLVEGDFEFNWHNLDVLIKLTFDIDFIPNIIINNSQVSAELLVDAVGIFIDRCIEFYGRGEVSRWNFHINYNNLLNFDDIDIISNELNDRIKDLNISYFFEY